MLGLLRRAWKTIFDFESDVSDLSDRLQRAAETERNLGSEVTMLQDEVIRLRNENRKQKSEIEKLRSQNQSLRSENLELQRVSDKRD